MQIIIFSKKINVSLFIYLSGNNHLSVVVLTQNKRWVTIIRNRTIAKLYRMGILNNLDTIQIIKMVTEHRLQLYPLFYIGVWFSNYVFVFT